MNHPAIPSSRPESPRLRRAATKFALAVAVCLASSFLALNTPDGSWVLDWALLFILLSLTQVVSFACIILCFFELFGALRAVCVRRPFLGLLFDIPQFLFGLFCFVMGLGLIVVGCYIIFVERLPESLGEIQTLALVLLLAVLFVTPAKTVLLPFLIVTFQPLLIMMLFGLDNMTNLFRPILQKKKQTSKGKEIP
jgi:hypothetical protein